MEHFNKYHNNALFVFMILLWSIYVFSQNFNYQFAFSDDKIYYIPAAKMLMNGTSPDKINFEHPPLGKYIIGFSWIITGNFFTISRIFGVLSILLIYLFTSRIYNKKIGLFVSAALSFDTLYMYTFTTALLDVYATFFIFLSLYLLVLIIDGKESLIWHILFGISLGAAVASKWSVLPVSIMLIAYLYLIKRSYLKYLPLVFLSIFAIYLLSYIMYFMHGHSFIDFLKLQVEMLAYQGGFHHPTAIFLVIMFTKLFLRLWMMISYSFGVITISSNSVLVNATLQGRLFTINVTQGSPLWYLFFPSILLYSWKLTKVFNKKEALPLLSFLAYTPILFSNLIDWYILTILPFLYMIVFKVFESRPKLILILLIISFINFELVINNIIHDYQFLIPT